MTFDFVTVAYGLDLPLLRLQARSLSRYLDPAICGQILVLGNDPKDRGLAGAFRDTVLPEYGAFSAAVRYLDGAEVSDFSGTPRSGHGWRRQQGLKLDVHRFIRSGAYVTLDCKNHLIRPTGADAFADAEGRLRVAPRGVKPEHMSAFHYFGIPEEEWPASIFQITTPFPLRTAEVAALDGHFREEGFRSVGAFLTSEQDIYEYRLYCAFLLKFRGGWEGVHTLAGPPSSTFFARTDLLENVLRAVDRPGTRIMGIHRRACWSSPEEKAAIVKRWLRFGLVGDLAEGEAVLTPPPGAVRPV